MQNMKVECMSESEFEALLVRRAELTESQAEYAEEYQDPACALRAYQLGLEIERLTAAIDEQLELESAEEYGREPVEAEELATACRDWDKGAAEYRRDR